MNLPLIVQKGLRVFRHCLKGHLLYLIASCCGIVPSGSFWMVLEMVRKIPERLRSETKINRRTEHSNRSAGRTEGSIGSRGNVHCKCREWRDLNSKSRHKSPSKKMVTGNPNFGVEALESTEDVDSAQAAAATFYKDWLDLTSVDINFPKSLSNFLEGKPGKRTALRKYYQQGEPRKGDHQTDLIQICQI